MGDRLGQEWVIGLLRNMQPESIPYVLGEEQDVTWYPDGNDYFEAMRLLQSEGLARAMTENDGTNVYSKGGVVLVRPAAELLLSIFVQP